MITASTGEFSYPVDVNEFGDVKTQFHFRFDDMVDLAMRASIHEKELNSYSRPLCAVVSLSSDFERAVDEAVGVLNEERQAAVYCLLSELLDAAYITGACQVLSGLDPAVRELTAKRAKRARAARTSPEREAAMAAAIKSHGPKVANIQRQLRRLDIDLGNDAVRRRRNNAASR